MSTEPARPRAAPAAPAAPPAPGPTAPGAARAAPPAPRAPARWLAIGTALALLALVALSVRERWAELGSSPFPIGVDGYFYPIQLRALLETGRLEYPSAPLALWLMAPLAALTDPITGAKLGAAIWGAAIAVPAYALGARLGGGRGPGLLAAVLATRAAGSAYLTLEFVKNSAGLAIAVAALWLLLRALEAPRASRIAAAAIAVVAAALTHKMALGLVAFVGGPAAGAAALARGAPARRRAIAAVAGVCAAATGLAIALGVAAPRRFPSLADAALLEGLLARQAHWTAPALATPRAALQLGSEALTAAVLALAALAAGTRAGRAAIAAATARAARALAGLRRRPETAAPPPIADRPPAGDRAAVVALAALALGVALPWLAVADAQGLGFRLRIAAFVPLALLAAVVAGRVLAAAPPRLRGALPALLAGALCLGTPGDRAEGRVATHPALVASVHAMGQLLPADAVVIVPERHIMFMVAWYLRAAVALRPEGVDPARRWRAMPLAWIEAGSALDRALLAARTGPDPPRGLHPRHANGMVLVPEVTWQRIAAALPPGARWRAWPTR